ncbi:hypothetical protein [Marinobacter sp. MBR-105]|jgi:hypothetical protein
MQEKNVSEILEAYKDHRQHAQGFIYGVRAMRKFGAFGVVPEGARKNPEIARIEMARFLISHLRLCGDDLFSDGEPLKQLQAAIDAEHPVGKDADTLLSLCYTASTLPIK